MDPVKEAFTKVKQDMDSIREQINSINKQIQEIKQILSNLTPTHIPNRQTDNQTNPTYPQIISKNQALYDPKSLVSEVSIGNDGVPTDSQTDKQTVKHTEITHKKADIDDIQRVSELLESLDSIKKDIRAKFKNLTNQEMLVFSTIYQLEEEKFAVDYSLISRKLGLTESSIRDYVQRMTKKGIPIIKTKEKNKKIFLTISPDLKRIASIQTILALREL